MAKKRRNSKKPHKVAPKSNEKVAVEGASENTSDVRFRIAQDGTILSTSGQNIGASGAAARVEKMLTKKGSATVSIDISQLRVTQKRRAGWHLTLSIASFVFCLGVLVGGAIVCFRNLNIQHSFIGSFTTNTWIAGAIFLLALGFIAAIARLLYAVAITCMDNYDRHADRCYSLEVGEYYYHFSKENFKYDEFVNILINLIKDHGSAWRLRNPDDLGELKNDVHINQ